MSNKLLVAVIFISFFLPYLIGKFCNEYEECGFGIRTYNLYALIEFIFIIAIAILVYRLGKKLLKK
jgi:hypothetical protein